MANYRYYLGPLQFSAIGTSPLACWHAPDGAVGMVDLRSNPECASQVAQVPKSLIWSVNALPSEYTLLGQGDCREINATNAMRQAWNSSLGFNPQGDTLLDLLADHLTRGSDPAGLDACKPLSPNASLDLDVWMPGHSRVWSEKFDWNTHRHAAKLKAMLREDAKELKKQLPQEAYEKWLGGMEHKYKGKIASEIDADARVRKPQTVLTETFDGTSGTLGFVYSWTEVTGNWSRSSGVADHQDTDITADARCDSDVSSADHYAQVTVTRLGNVDSAFDYFGSCSRFSSSARTYYACFVGKQESQIFLRKTVAGTPTSLTSNVGVTISLPQSCKVNNTGSSISGLWNGVTAIGAVTDTAISTGTRGGMIAYADIATPQQGDNWTCDDGIAAGGAGPIFRGRALGRGRTFGGSAFSC